MRHVVVWVALAALTACAAPAKNTRLVCTGYPTICWSEVVNE